MTSRRGNHREMSRIINVKVFPSSGRQEIIKIGEKDYRVYLKKQAREGKANVELLKELKKYLKRDVRIRSGLSSRYKRVEII